MSATTIGQLGGAKRRASVVPAAKAKEPDAKKLAANTLKVTAPKVSKASEQIVERKSAARKKPADEMPQAEANECGAEQLPESTVKKARTKAKLDADAAANDAGEDCTGAAGCAKCSDCGIPVKALTEAGKKRLVNKLLGLADSQATQGGFKITSADLIRLMQLHREMNPQKDRKVTVQWIEDSPE
jgi:hypothetical protein